MAGLAEVMGSTSNEQRGAAYRRVRTCGGGIRQSIRPRVSTEEPVGSPNNNSAPSCRVERLCIRVLHTSTSSGKVCDSGRISTGMYSTRHAHEARKPKKDRRLRDFLPIVTWERLQEGRAETRCLGNASCDRSAEGIPGRAPTQLKGFGRLTIRVITSPGQMEPVARSIHTDVAPRCAV
jgi:hypothetical protein